MLSNKYVMLLFSYAYFFSNLTLSKHLSGTECQTIRSVGPDLAPNFKQRVLADDKRRRKKGKNNAEHALPSLMVLLCSNALFIIWAVDLNFQIVLV